MSDNFLTKSAVSISEMARMVGLSRQRFAQLVKAGVFAAPQVEPETKRKFYDQLTQQSCLEVRKKNVGINGKVVLFYSARNNLTPTKPRRGKVIPPKQEECHADLVEGLKSLGLTSVTASQMNQAVKQVYPQGTKNLDHGEVLRGIFLHLKAKESKS
jgi:hypothetical protein